MGWYFARRLLQIIPVLLGVSFVVFLLMFLVPGDAALLMLGPEGTLEDLARLRHELGLDRNFFVQFFLWLGKVLQGDLGRSFSMKTEVAPLVWDRFKATFILTIAGLSLSSLFGVMAGIFSAKHRNSLADRIVTALALFGVSMPVFWLGIMAILLFPLRLGWFHVSGMNSPTGGGFLDLLGHLMLPAITMGLVSLGTVARFTRSCLLEVLGQDYVRTAHSKGLTPRRVMNRHALRNAWIPVVTIVGLQLGYLLGGAVLTERVFAWPGLGLLMLDAILQRDITVVQGGVLLIAVVFVLVNLVVDLLYAFLDPRIRYG